MTYYPTRQNGRRASSDDWKRSTIEALIYESGFDLCENDISTLRYNHFHRNSTPEFATCGMLIKEFQEIINRKTVQRYQLSNNSLFSTVKRIDRFSNRLGFLSEDALKKECELIVPETVDENNNIYQHLAPMKNLRLNMRHIRFQMITPALLLLLIRSFILSNKPLRTADWSNMVNILINAPLCDLEHEVNEEIIQLEVYQLRDKGKNHDPR